MKKRILSVCFVICLILISGCRFNGDGSASSTVPSVSSDSGSSLLPAASSGPTSSVPTGTVGDYFPVQSDTRYVYQGEGNEYASYTMMIDYSDGENVQQRINNGGTEAIRVIQVQGGRAICTFRQAEIYYRENFLKKTGETQDILLMEPIAAGTTWTLQDGSIKTIVSTNAEAKTPSGSYSAVMVVTQNSYGTTTDYYVKNIGLVKTVSTGENYEVSSSLSEIQKNVPFIQTLRFYYPNVSDGKLYYTDRAVSFHTNDITRKVLEAAYKEQLAEPYGTVFSENTKINSFYLNRDGMAYLDLSREFITEMNAGSGTEAMLLQCAANTFGSYCGAEKVILTVENQLYESGHIKLQKGEFLSVNTQEAIPMP